VRTINFGIIGCGLMGREFASASARWCHLTNAPDKHVISAICDTNAGLFDWYKKNFDSITQFTGDYHELLKNPQIEAVYCALPHNLHKTVYCDIISARKHLLGEKPFGIDKAANDAIVECCRRHSDVFVRCSSEFPFYPAVQRIGEMIETNAFGRIIEATSCFLHSSDLDVNKPINWKRMIEVNG